MAVLLRVENIRMAVDSVRSHAAGYPEMEREEMAFEAFKDWWTEIVWDGTPFSFPDEIESDQDALGLQNFATIIRAAHREGWDQGIPFRDGSAYNVLAVRAWDLLWIGLGPIMGRKDWRPGSRR